MEHTINSCGRYPIHQATRISRRQMIACCVLALSFFTFHFSLSAQDSVRRLDEVIIQDVRVSNKTPLTTSTLDRQELDDARSEMSIPYMLETQPSVVSSGENGAIGGTYIRIRGVEPNRINVNLNGITLNDPESQQVFWYNIPNLGGMSQSLQIQRGVGASTGGSSAMGAAINMQTLNARNSAYGEADLGFGSWNTRQYGISAGSGILKNGLSFDFAYSGLTSDGFVRSWGTDQQSFFGSMSWYGKRTLIKLLTIIGNQKTGIAWNGADAAQLDADPTYNSAGEYDMDGDTMYYDNETDNYWQRHYQLYVSHLLTDKWSLKGAFDFMHGGGYYEQYMTAWSDYNNSPYYGLSDVVFRKQMDNYTYTGNAAVNYNGDKLTFSLGDNFIFYDGDQFGRVIWVRDTSLHASLPNEWYNNQSAKLDNSVYAKSTYDFNENLNAYADLQLRMVSHRIHGNSDDVLVSPAYGLYIGDFDFTNNYLFFNPKLGVNYRIDDHQRTYFVAGINSREPVRFDIMSAYANNDTIKPETMLDIELGYQIAHSRWALNANLYAMLYHDQMTPNGDVLTGYALMENVDKSYRIGIELEGGYQFCRWFRMDANLTLSQNKVLDNTYSDFTDGDMAVQTYTATTDLALSPSVVGAAIATFSPCKDAKLQLIGKYVGKQYADNTSRECYAIDPYFLLNAKASYTWHLKGTNEIEAQLVVNNALNHNYRLNAWASDWGDTYTTPGTTYFYHLRGYLQQPGINFMGRIIYRF
ncbi:MAG: TonB-dependent receptor plug domain-containing protein [Bacteroidales bacterium]|nr:TonB-dependent receptor plug domain-containing protein [Bacteroidales bacterium]